MTSDKRISIESLKDAADMWYLLHFLLVVSSNGFVGERFGF